MIRLGTSVLGGELGVRLLTVLCSTATLFLLWFLIGEPRQKRALNTFLLLCLSMPFFHVYGFVSTPDAPLLFFTVVFLLLYRRLLEPAHWGLWLLWGACMAGLMYSKYHGALVIGLGVLARPGMLLNPRFYLAALFGALLFTPHLAWQFEHDFPSFRYHLLGRNRPFQLKHLIAYLGNQMVIFNPASFPLMIIALVIATRSLFRENHPMRQVYVVMVIGFWLIFFLSVFRGHVEPQWTMVLSIPLLILAYDVSRVFGWYRKSLRRLILVSLLPLFLIRIVALKGVLEDQKPVFTERHWVYSLHEKAGDVPVIFNNAYRQPALYSFYSGQEAYSTFTAGASRVNQYYLWDWQETMQGRPAAIVMDSSWLCLACEPFQWGSNLFRLKKALKYPLVPELAIVTSGGPREWQAGDTLRVQAAISNPYDQAIVFGQGQIPLKLVALFLSSEEKETHSNSGMGENPGNYIPIPETNWSYFPIDTEMSSLAPGNTITVSLSVPVPDIGQLDGHFGIGVRSGNEDPFLPSTMVPVRPKQ